MNVGFDSRQPKRFDSVRAGGNKFHSTGSIPVLTTKNKVMKNENLKAVLGLVLAIGLLLVIKFILKLTNSI